MMIVCEADNQINSETHMAKTRRYIHRLRSDDTFGGRLKLEREKKELKQSDVVELLAKKYDIHMSEAAYSKIELGETKAPKLDFMVAMSKIVDADLLYLLTGEERGEVAAYSEEAEQIAAMIDQMQPSTRQMMMAAAKAAMHYEEELLQTQRELAELLLENITLIENGKRKRVDAYIDRIGIRYQERK